MLDEDLSADRLILLGVILLSPAAHASGQERHDRAHCRPREAWQACYDRASALAIDSVRAARQRQDTTREARLLLEMIPVMSEICDGGKLGAACYFAGRLDDCHRHQRHHRPTAVYGAV